MAFSLLPFWLMYKLTKPLAFLLFYVFKYRRKVVFKNLSTSFPENTEIKKTAWRYYVYLSEVFLETIKCLTISKKCLLRRITCDNPEVIEQYTAGSRSVILMSAHFGNWEYLIYAMNLMFTHLAVGVGKPLSNQVFNKLTNAKRAKFGMKIINANTIKDEFNELKQTLTASLFLADQYTGNAQKGYKTDFFNKETLFPYGAEKYAKEYNYPVIYADITRIRRGRYNVHLIEISPSPVYTVYGEIMKEYVHLLNTTIRRQPAYWLWSHKRWKNVDKFYVF